MNSQTTRQSGVARRSFLLAKRLLDTVIGGLCLAAATPLLIAIGVVYRVSGEGDLLYVHERVGLHGRRFRCYKLRTMRPDADRLRADLAASNEHADGRTFKIKRDPRVTRIGFWLRKLSIDELPQLYNVVRGEMSLVGPRPPLPSETVKYADVDWRRLSVKPGITCLWQVSGRADLPYPKQLELDLLYIERRSLLVDVGILFRTVPAVLLCRGAY